MTAEELRLPGRPSSRMRSAPALAHAHRLPKGSPAHPGPRLRLAARYPGGWILGGDGEEKERGGAGIPGERSGRSRMPSPRIADSQRIPNHIG